MINIRMYCTAYCAYCVRAEMLFRKKGVSLNKIFIEALPGGFGELFDITGRRTVPQIFIGERHVGGYDDIAALESAGKLDPLLVIA